MIDLTIYHQTSESNQEYLKNFYEQNSIKNKVFTFENKLSEIMSLCVILQSHVPEHLLCQN